MNAFVNRSLFRGHSFRVAGGISIGEKPWGWGASLIGVSGKLLGLKPSKLWCGDFLTFGCRFFCKGVYTVTKVCLYRYSDGRDMKCGMAWLGNRMGMWGWPKIPWRNWRTVLNFFFFVDEIFPKDGCFVWSYPLVILTWQWKYTHRVGSLGIFQVDLPTQDSSHISQDEPTFLASGKLRFS